MAGEIKVGLSKKIHHIPLSWDVNKAKSNHQPKFRPVGDAILRGREKSVGKIMEQMFLAMPPVELWIDGKLTPEQYLERAEKISEPYMQQIAALLQVSFNEGAIMQQDRIRADANEQLKRLRSPLRLTDEKGKVTKATVGGIDVGEDPKIIWSPVGIEAFDEVSSASVQYAQFRSATLVTAMLEEQQRVIQELIGESFTASQTFSTGRTVTGLTTGQTSRALFEVLEEMNPNTPLGRQLAQMRGINSAGLTHPWEKAVFRRSEKIAQQLADKGIGGARAYNKIRDDSNKYAKKLRRSRARVISRTEIKRAQVAGQLDSMQEAVNSGLADPRTAGKKWITGSTDVCPICTSLGFGRAIHIRQSFPNVGDGPPAHPNCRCDLDFAHRIKDAPQAVGAGNPNFPAGSPENPIVWQFNSGFQSSPNVTTAFRPPSVPRTPRKPVKAPSPSAQYSEIPDVDDEITEKIVEVYETTEGTHQQKADAVYQYLGYKGKPKVVEWEDLGKHVDESPAGEMRRVVRETKDKTNPITGVEETFSKEEIAEQFRTGQAFTGEGLSGTGTYTYEGTAGAFDEYAMSRKGKWETVEMTLAPDAKIMTLTDETERALKKKYKDLYPDGPTDIGLILASKGFDAIRLVDLDDEFGNVMMIILNRSKVIVSKVHGAEIGKLKPFKRPPPPTASVPPTPTPATVDEVIEEIDAVPLQSKPTPTETGKTWEDDAFHEINATVTYTAGRMGTVIEEAIDEVSQVLGNPIPSNALKTHIKTAPIKRTSKTGDNVRVLGDFSPSRKIQLPRQPKRPKKMDLSTFETRGGYGTSQAIDHRRWAKARELDRELGDDVTTFTDELLEEMAEEGEFPFANWKEAGYKSEQDFKNAVEDFYTKEEKYWKDIEDIFNGIDPATGEAFETFATGELKDPRYEAGYGALDDVPARRDIRIGEENSYKKGTPEYNSSLKSTFHHENGHNIDFMHLSTNAPSGDDIAAIERFLNNLPRNGTLPADVNGLQPRSSTLLRVLDLKMQKFGMTRAEAITSLQDEADMALMRLFQLIEDSEATKRIDTYVQGLIAKAKTPQAREQAVNKGNYLTDPTERIARIFQQYIPTRVGSVTDRKLLAEAIAGDDGITGELFSVGEFEGVIVPAFEKWLRAVGMIE